MSKKDDQAVVSLSVVVGCLTALRDKKAFSRVDIKAAVHQSLGLCCKAILEWPGMNNRAWTKDRLEQFKRFVHETDDKYFSSDRIIIKMCCRIVEDLNDQYDVIGIKRSLISPVVPLIQTIDNFSDPNGANFPAYERADYLVDGLYEIIELVEYA